MLTRILYRLFLVCSTLLFADTLAMAGQAPTRAAVSYGSDAAQVLDFWKAEGSGARPAVLILHSGAWLGGSRDEAGILGLDEFLKAGISVASADFRTVTAARDVGVEPPVKWPMQDASRALQFLRSKAGEWGIDGTRIGVEGRSSGGTMALWLALHDDMANAKASDPVARESTRVAAAGAVDALTTLDPVQMREWIPNCEYGGHAFGFFGPLATAGARVATAGFDDFLQARERILPSIREYSPAALVKEKCPPVYLYYGAPPMASGKGQPDPVHSAVFGIKLAELLRAVGVEAQVKYPGASGVRDFDQVEFLIRLLQQQ